MNNINMIEEIFILKDLLKIYLINMMLMIIDYQNIMNLKDYMIILVKN